MDHDVAELLHTLDEAKARRLLEGLGQRAALREFGRQCAVRFAVDLLLQRAERPQIRDRLMQRYGLERRTAYLRIDEALTIYCRPVVQVCKGDARNCTPTLQDQGSIIANRTHDDG
jgi:hypothetical protein